jgi:amino acid transporter
MTAVVVAAYGADAIEYAAESNPANLVVNLFIRHTPPLIVEAMHLLLLGSAFAALLALHNVANRYLYTLGRERLLPQWLAATHVRYKSPWRAGLMQSLLAVSMIVLTVVLGVDPYLGLLLWGSALGLIGIIFLWTLCAAAIVLYMHRHGHLEALWSSTVAPLGAFGVLVTILVLALSNVSFLTAATPLVDRLLLGAGALAFGLGIGASLSMRYRHPDHYAKFAAGRPL